jgi:hypothetical protein
MSVQGIGCKPDGSLGGSFCPQQRGRSAWVVPGTPVQGMIVTIPIGVLCFFPIEILTVGVTRPTIMRPPRPGQGRAGSAAAQQLLGTSAGVGVHHPFSAARHSSAMDLLV